MTTTPSQRTPKSVGLFSPGQPASGECVGFTLFVDDGLTVIDDDGLMMIDDRPMTIDDD